MFTEGEKVIYLPENKVYDFGYVGGTGKAIIYEEGERNSQDSFAVDIDKLIKANIKKPIKNQLLKGIFEASELDTKSLTQKALKLSEETGEVAQAVLSYTEAPGCAAKNKTKEDVIEECVDCVITATSIIYQVQNGEVNEEELLNEFNRKLRKWISKFK